MSDLLNTIAASLGEANTFLNTVRELPAIWMDGPVMTSEGRKRRIAPGQGIKIENGKLVDLPEWQTPTHTIL